MKKSVEATGKTIELAIETALQMLGKDRDSVSVEVLEKPKSGFLGLGSTLARVLVTYDISPADRAKDFLEGLLDRMNAHAYPEVSLSADGGVDVNIKGDSLGMLIGRRGETLNAIQHITNYVVNRDEEERTRVVVDIENYRGKREDSLRKLAEKTAEKAIRYRRNIALEPMNAYERHVIHAALQENPDISTFSSGSEPRRCVVVSYTPGGEKPANTGSRPPRGRRPSSPRPPQRQAPKPPAEPGKDE